MNQNPYRRLAERLDALPNGFPKTDSGIELRLLRKLFSAEEAELVSRLRMTEETPGEISSRIGADPDLIGRQLKEMARRGLISWKRSEKGPAFGLLPFVVGIYEYQLGQIDKEFAQLFEDYYLEAFGEALSLKPQFHRIVPINESIQSGLEIRPYESASEIVRDANAWGVIDCICRTQKALIGEPCEHPKDVCMMLSEIPGAFDHIATIRTLTENEALTTLERAAEAGLVHSVSNSQKGIWYICNCCTCSCGILRGMSEMGIANVVARSAFVNMVDEELCLACGDCLESCQFNALSLNDTAHVNVISCVGCGVCALNCPENALTLVRRPEAEIMAPPVSKYDWQESRASYRGIDLMEVL